MGPNKIYFFWFLMVMMMMKARRMATVKMPSAQFSSIYSLAIKYIGLNRTCFCSKSGQ